MHTDNLSCSHSSQTVFALTLIYQGLGLARVNRSWINFTSTCLLKDSSHKVTSSSNTWLWTINAKTYALTYLNSILLQHIESGNIWWYFSYSCPCGIANFTSSQLDPKGLVLSPLGFRILLSVAKSLKDNTQKWL